MAETEDPHIPEGEYPPPPAALLGDSGGHAAESEEGNPYALLLDLDGTLVDTAYLHTLAWQRALRASGFDVPAYRIHRLIGMGGDQLVAALLGDSVQQARGEELSAGWRRHYEPLLPEARPLPGAAGLIRHAEGAGWRIVFASSSPAQHLEHYLGLLDAAALRERSTTSDDVQRTKPAPDLIEIALRLAGTRRVVLVGDSPHDVSAAARAGVPAVCVLTGGYSSAELTQAGALRTYETPEELVHRFHELPGLVSLVGSRHAG
jgi:phosphoglycolate phosphatase-like HAD superfamily hydrolase